MLAMALSGIYLWWPRNAGFLRGLRWRRGPTLPLNLHHLFGFWIAIPLAVVSAIGVYLGFPQQGREFLSSLAPVTPPQRGGFAVPLLREPRLDLDRALGLARQNLASQNLASHDAARMRLAANFLPNRQSQVWRVQLRSGKGDGLATILVDDRTDAVTVVKPMAGDRIAQWIRWIHEGSHAGALWQTVVFLCGLLPSLFAITGLMIWLRSRRTNEDGQAIAGVPYPAE